MWPGILMIQVANLCFAAGQVEYKRWAENHPILARKSWHHFAYLYIGAVLVAGAAAGVNGFGSFHPSSTQWWVLLYLGVIPSALGFYFWNIGTHRVNAGTLAVFNNVKIPLAVAASLLLFGEEAELVRLAISAVVIASGFVVAVGLKSRLVKKENHCDY
jgi:drug/metabolite transporter (DMT)-like permease